MINIPIKSLEDFLVSNTQSYESINSNLTRHPNSALSICLVIKTTKYASISYLYLIDLMSYVVLDKLFLTYGTEIFHSERGKVYLSNAYMKLRDSYVYIVKIKDKYSLVREFV